MKFEILSHFLIIMCNIITLLLMKYHVYHDQNDVLVISYGPPKLLKVNGKVIGIIIFL